VFPKLLFSGVAILLSTVAAIAQNAPTPIDAAALLKELLHLQASQKHAKAGQLGQLARQFQDASRTDGEAGRMYADSVRIVDYSSQMGDAKRFQDWRIRKKDLLDNKAFQTALKFHLRYLAVTLNASASAKAGGPPPYQDIIAYVADVAQARPQLSGDGIRGEDQQDFHELLEKPLSEGKIAKAQAVKPDIEQFVGNGPSKNWEPMAGNWQQILETDVRVSMRQTKNPKLLDTWQFQMKLESDQLAGGRDGMGKANFTQMELPKLMWSRARDLAVLGQENEAIIEMAKLVRTYPQHPDFPAWVGELAGILQEKAAPAAVTPATGGS
jgi:hypothetical protein